MNKLNLQALAGGAVAEQINMEIQKVYDNIMDPNTDNQKARKLTITISLKPNKNDNEIIDVDVVSKASLCPVNSIGTRMLIGRDGDGRVVANEWEKDRMKGQIAFDGPEPTVEPTAGNVIDYQKVKAN